MQQRKDLIYRPNHGWLDEGVLPSSYRERQGNISELDTILNPTDGSLQHLEFKLVFGWDKSEQICKMGLGAAVELLRQSGITRTSELNGYSVTLIAPSSNEIKGFRIREQNIADLLFEEPEKKYSK